jgi:capsid protein
LETVVLDRILTAWLDEAVYIPELWPEVLGTYTEWPHQWYWDGYEHVDPVKEATAQSMRLLNNTTTLAYEYAQQGYDWEEALRQRAKEQALMNELGLKMLGVGSMVTPPGDYDKEEPTDTEEGRSVPERTPSTEWLEDEEEEEEEE